LLAAARRIAGKLQDLATLLDSVSIALMLTRPAGVCLLHIVGFAAVHVPRLVTWRGVGEILVLLILLDLLRVPW
jgi:hypothetical protein